MHYWKIRENLTSADIIWILNTFLNICLNQDCQNQPQLVAPFLELISLVYSFLFSSLPFTLPSSLSLSISIFSLFLSFEF